MAGGLAGYIQCGQTGGERASTPTAPPKDSVGQRLTLVMEQVQLCHTLASDIELQIGISRDKKQEAPAVSPGLHGLALELGNALMGLRARLEVITNVLT